MNKPQLLQVNRSVVVKPLRGGKPFRTVIQEVNRDGFAVLGDPEAGTALRVGETVKMEVMAPDARYEFKSTLERVVTEPLYLYYFSLPEEVKRVQERKFVRAKVVLEIGYAVGTEGTDPASPPELYKKAYTVDLSGGGAQLILKEKLEVNSILWLRLPLPDGREPLVVKGRVKRVESKVVDGLRRYEVGLAFEGLSERDVDRIMRFVFQRLLKERWQEG
ncbi:MAG: PilZ domain-containing protein [Thermanaeromonas sp.]|uniref:flagellar brake protein n=1 Tax=Thermanaeromonas sp. TaxID=2003697 RepID=UPI00243E3330|nr:PilZ domain-containing protein [Thermanaeromonas sp.]MCG0278135.1 PilZ domain-containing protein [Thermanaeromonas sp.]